MKIEITTNGTGMVSIKLDYNNKTYVEHWEDRGTDGLYCNDSIENQLNNEDVEGSEEIIDLLDDLDIGKILEISDMEG